MSRRVVDNIDSIFRYSDIQNGRYVIDKVMTLRLIFSISIQVLQFYLSIHSRQVFITLDYSFLRKRWNLVAISGHRLFSRQALWFPFQKSALSERSAW